MRLHRGRAKSVRQIVFVGASAAADCARQQCLAIFIRATVGWNRESGSKPCLPAGRSRTS